VPNPLLEALASEASGCTKCPLAYQGRTQVVFGVGNPEADLMFVGEGPGAEEDRQGIPFVGKSGKLLDRIMAEELGIDRSWCYVANVVKCLRYTAMVQLADGSWERIGRLVRHRYDGEVMSVDGDGRLVPRSVIGWYESPLAGRRMFRLTHRHAKRAGLGKVSIELTGDHEVLTDEGWLPVDRFVAGTRIATGQGLSEVARDVVYGTVLGDGHLNSKSAHLSMGHSGLQEEYARFKADLLAELSPAVDLFQVAAVAGGERRYAAVHVRTLASRALRLVRPEFYVDGRKQVPPWLAEVLNARMLAIWFMDDGYTRIRPPRRPNAEIATCGFAPVDLDVLVAGLARLGIEATAVRGRLQFGVVATKRLAETIAPYVPPSMRFKLHPGVANRVPFDPDLWRPGLPEVMYDEAEVLDITDRPRTDTTVFCIDVEGTHNFVTAGGVVHNCRPPGNRDPLPLEIDTCRPYLERQIDLIRPKVVITLGRFAAQLLLDSKDGINRLRGSVHPYRGTLIVPTFHPAAVLRGGGETMARMRADFVRAKRALIEVGAQPWTGQVQAGSPA
jgi:uracil-DNA glycosylase